MIQKILPAMIFLLLLIPVSEAQKANYDEALVPLYSLPDPLRFDDGTTMSEKELWESRRRDQILKAFADEIYGHVPPGKLDAPRIVLHEESYVLEGKALRKQVTLVFNKAGRRLPVEVLVYLPVNIETPSVFVGYNFYGNHTIIDDPEVRLTGSWVRNNEAFGITDNKASEASRGVRSNRWPVEKIIEGGFGLVTAYYGDVDPDFDDFSDGIHPFFYDDGQSKPKNHEWGSIAAWAWGMSRIVDYLESDEYLGNSHFIAFGHSRLGKTSLWAGATDERFSIVISNNSGCGGAALFRRKYGETAAIINKAFPHWFADQFNSYSGREEDLPVDQHMLISLIAPRPVYIASAVDDRWADPKGEYLSGYHAGRVYKLYGLEALRDDQLPAVDQPVHTPSMGYHIRSGGHDVKDYDWEQFMIFARQHLD